jgi:hypothetical protein
MAMADRLNFEIDVELETGLITGRAGVPGLIEAFRQTGTAAVVGREIKLKGRKRGLSASEMVESLLAMWAAGGGRRISINSGRTRRWRCCWAMNCRRRRRRVISWRNSMPRICRCCKEGKSSVPTESAPLLSLAKANAERVLDMQCRRPVKTATLDVDATVIACDKRAAKRGL